MHYRMTVASVIEQCENIVGLLLFGHGESRRCTDQALVVCIAHRLAFILRGKLVVDWVSNKCASRPWANDAEKNIEGRRSV